MTNKGTNRKDGSNIKKKKRIETSKPVQNQSFLAKFFDSIANLFKKEPGTSQNKVKSPLKTDDKTIENLQINTKKDEIKPEVKNDIANESKLENDSKEKLKKEDLLKSEKENKEEDDGDDKEEDEGESNSSRFSNKFLKKDGFKGPKDLKQIAEEAREKSEKMKDRAFTDGDAAKQDLKKAETGYNQVVKKKTKKALQGKIFLIRGKDNGRPAWHYILVPPENIKQLRQQRAGSNIDVTDYGKIVRSGWGENPSDKIVKEIEEEYGD